MFSLMILVFPRLSFGHSGMKLSSYSSRLQSCLRHYESLGSHGKRTYGGGIHAEAEGFSLFIQDHSSNPKPTKLRT